MAQYRVDSNKFLADGTTIFEAVQIADQYGNLIGAANPSGMAVDAFGRARASQPYTLFDSFHRYQDNGRINQANSVNANTAHDANAGVIKCNIDTSANAYVYRESSRVFPYQPGKSLQILQTFVLNPPQANLTQRYGYFGNNNGFFLEQANSDIYFVKRSSSNGSIVETRVPQSEWNIDTLQGQVNSSPSHFTLDLTKAQILFTDVEWLGVGSVRQGFVIDGKFIHCHTWHHANYITSTYMTTACLPVRAEIFNTGVTAANSILKIICSSVISEGGFEPKGNPRTAGEELGNAKTLTTAGTYYPIVSIRLKDSRADGIAFIRSVQFLGLTNNRTYKYKLVKGCTLTGANWVSAGTDSSVEYDFSATGLTNGTDLRIDYTNVASGAGAAVSQIDPSDIFRYQLERNSFAANNVGTIFSLVATGSSGGETAIGAIQWEEIT